jgi:hypothetical protein
LAFGSPLTTRLEFVFSDVASLKENAKPLAPLMVFYLERTLKVKPAKTVDLTGPFETLLRIAPEDPAVAKAVFRLTESSYDPHRASAIDRLSNLKDANPELTKRCMDILANLLKSTNEDTLEVVVRECGEFGHDAETVLPVLKQLRTHKSESIRRSATKAVAKIEAMP